MYDSIIGLVFRKLILLFVIGTVACQSEAGKVPEDVSENIPEKPEILRHDSLTGTFYYPVRDTFGLNLLFDTITELEFQNLKRIRVSSDLIMDSSGIEIPGDSLILTTAHARLKFAGPLNTENVSQTAEPFRYSSFLGKIPGTHFYVLNRWHSGSILTGSMMLIDSISNYAFYTGSVSDGATDEVFISPYDGFIIYYSNAYHIAGLGLLQYIPGSDTSLRQISSFKLYGQIEEIFWTRNNRVVVKINDRKRENSWADNYHYIASYPLHYSFNHYRDSSSDSLEIIGLNRYLKYPYVYPDPDIEHAEPVIRDISEEEYKAAKEMNLSSRDTTDRNIQRLAKRYLIRSSDSLYMFPGSPAPWHSRWYSFFKCYHPKMKLFEVYLVDGTHAIGQLVLVDSISNRIIKPSGPFDSGITDLKFSENGQYLLGVSNSVFDPWSYLVVWRVSRDNTGQLHFVYVLDHEMRAWNIEEFKWVSTDQIMMKTVQGLYDYDQKREDEYKLLKFKLL